MARGRIGPDPLLLMQIQDAASRRLDDLLQAWDKQIEADFERLRKQGAKLERQKTQDAIASGKKHYLQIEADRRTAFAALASKQSQEAADAALTQSVVSHLEGLAESAMAGDIAVSIPTGFRIASSSLIGPALSGLNDLIGDLAAEVADGDDQSILAQRSALWALGNGLSPHGADLAQILSRHALDAPYAQLFAKTAERLDASATKQFGHGQLKGAAAHEQLDHLAQHVAALRGFGNERLVKLVTSPTALVGTASATPPTIGPKTSMPPVAFNAMIDNLFGKK